MITSVQMTSRGMGIWQVCPCSIAAHKRERCLHFGGLGYLVETVVSIKVDCSTRVFDAVMAFVALREVSAFDAQQLVVRAPWSRAHYAGQSD